MQANSGKLLNRIVTRETYSLLQYLNDAWPWTGPRERQTLEQLQKLAEEDKQETRRFAMLLTRRRMVPTGGWFPEEFSETHYLALDHLLPRLVRHQRWTITESEKDLSGATEPDIIEAGLRLLDMKRRHLIELERLTAEYADGKPVSTLR